MKQVLSIIFCQVTSITCILCAFFLLMENREGWYWFLFMTLLTGYQLKTTKEGK